MPKIHPTAVVDPQAELCSDVEVGPYCVIQGRVIIGAGTVIQSHSVIHGHTVIAQGCKIGPAAYIGMDGQHLTPVQEATSLYIGEQCVIRETATIHRSMKPGEENATRLGNRCFVMAGGHVGHDSRIGNDVVIAHGAMIGGHSKVGDRTFLGGGCAVHQFVQVGRLVIVSGNEALTHDAPPFAAIRYDAMKGYNAVGCRRAGLSREAISAIRAVYHAFHTHRTTFGAVQAIEKNVPMLDEVKEILDFVRSSKRGLQPSLRHAGHGAEENGN